MFSILLSIALYLDVSVVLKISAQRTIGREKSVRGATPALLLYPKLPRALLVVTLIALSRKNTRNACRGDRIYSYISYHIYDIRYV